MEESFLPLLGAFIIGLSKAGFAAGLGMLTTPLLATSIPAKTAIGVVLPLLIVADFMTLGVYWKKWNFSMVRFPLAGVVAGIAVGMFFVTTISDRFLKVSIGATALLMVCLLVFRNWWRPGSTYRPSWWEGALVGAFAGFSSTISHGAGPIMAIFLLAQKPSKEVFVASMALFFTLNNLLKTPPYIYAGLINWSTLKQDLFFIPAIPLGVLAGWLIHRALPQKRFDILVYLLLFITSLNLLFF